MSKNKYQRKHNIKQAEEIQLTKTKKKHSQISASRLNNINSNLVKNWYWVVLIFCIGIISAFSAVGSGSFWQGTYLLLEFDQQIDTQTVIDTLKSDNVSIESDSIELIAANRAEIRTNLSKEQLESIAKKITESKVVINSVVGQQGAYQILNSNYIDIVILLVVSMLALTSAIFILVKDLKFKDKLKLSVYQMIIPILSALTLAAVGTAISRLGLISFSFETYEFMLTVIVIVIFLNVNTLLLLGGKRYLKLLP